MNRFIADLRRKRGVICCKSLLGEGIEYLIPTLNFHIRTVHLDIIKVLFIH